MILAIIMAIWFGIDAKKVGKSVIVWAIVGFVLTFIVSTMFSILGSFLIDVKTYPIVKIISVIISIVTMVLIESKLLPSPVRIDSKKE